ncbi:MAG: hypothetical protein RLZZ239_904 [Pseudomonadota bacterium]
MNDSTPFSTHSAPHLDALSALFGPLPPQDDPCQVVLAHHWQGAQHRVSVWQVSVGQPAWVSWLLYRAEPLGPQSEITLLSPDGCWPQVVNEAAIQAVLAQGVALAWFDRVGLAWDGPDAQRGGPVHQHWPEVPWSATAVWAWGMGYSITALEQALQAPKIGVIGHSRGGKAAMAAALWDSRIQALVSHNSGTGGVSRLQPAQPGAESLADLAERFPHWLSPLAQNPQHQALCEQNNWPADGLHALAPRGLCILQAEDDLWANPAGSRATFEHLQPAWQAAPERLRWHSRSGGHAMTALDWQRAALFLKQVLG